MQFTGLTDDHLDNYREPKSKSNVYSRARLELKEWMMGLSGPLRERLRAQGHPTDLMASDHHPSLWNQKNVDRQWVFFSRDREEREKLERLVDHERSLASTLMDPTPFFKSSFLCVALSGDGFEAAVKLHWKAWVDRDDFLTRMRDDAQRDAFLELLENLPEEYVIEVQGGPSHPITSVGPEELSSILEQFEDTQGLLSVGLHVDPERTVELGEDLGEVASVAFLLLAPVYDALSWSEEQDWIGLSDREEAIHREREAIARQHQAETEAYETRKAERQKQQQQRFEEQRDQLMEQQVYKERMRRITAPSTSRERRSPEPEPEPERAPAPQKPAAPTPRRQTPSGRSPKPQPARRKRADTLRAVPFEVRPGARVEVTEGVLAGKWGIVQEIDRRGQAKVVMGSLIARVPQEHLAATRPRRR